ncbi:MAG: DUF3014 domain-containing protein [Burkholderiales bacterium]
MKDPIKWVAAVLGLAGIAAIFFYRWYNQEPELQAPVAPPPAAVTVAPPPAPEPEPQIQHPIAESAQPLPLLDESDAALRERITELIGQKALVEFFYLDKIIRRIVATIDNLPREKVAQRLMPLQPPRGRFVAKGDDENATLSPENYGRYTPYVKLAETVNTQKLVAVYVHFYPLFQRAYKELGYPNGYFNDRLIEVIDHLLAAPEAQGPLKLTRPSVFYRFADPELESLSAGRKILLRMGSENAAKVKAKLKTIRKEITGQDWKP